MKLSGKYVICPCGTDVPVEMAIPVGDLRCCSAACADRYRPQSTGSLPLRTLGAPPVHVGRCRACKGVVGGVMADSDPASIEEYKTLWRSNNRQITLEDGPIALTGCSCTLNLPAGLTCGDCLSFDRCEWLIQCKAQSTVCDFNPVRFRPKFSVGSAVISTAQDYYPEHVGVVIQIRTGADKADFPTGIDVSVELEKYPGICAFDAGDLALVESEVASCEST